MVSKESITLGSSKDKIRSLLTDCLPFETLIGFSNNNFYKHLNSNDDTLKKMLAEICKYTGSLSLFSYKYSRNRGKFRQIDIIHPIGQIRLCDFFKDNNLHILYTTNRSLHSLRHPIKLNPSKMIIEKQDADKIDQSLLIHGHYNTGPYARIYYFTESELFVKCEIDFNYLMKLDIQNCFKSIYTHVFPRIEFGKRDSKKNKETTNFYNSLDKLIQNISNGETHGIPIGAEFMRIVVEILLQCIDNRISSELHKNGYTKESVEFFRYVDDYFVFLNNINEKDSILSIISTSLNYFNLTISEHKTSVNSTPITTEVENHISTIDAYSEDTFARIMGRQRGAKHLTLIRSLLDQNRDKGEKYINYLVSKLIQHKKENQLSLNVDINDTKNLTHIQRYMSVLSYIIQVVPTFNSHFKVMQEIITISQLNELDNNVGEILMKEIENVIVAYTRLSEIRIELYNSILIALYLIDRYKFAISLFPAIDVALKKIKISPNYNGIIVQIVRNGANKSENEKLVLNFFKEISYDLTECEVYLLFFDIMATPDNYISKKVKRQIFDKVTSNSKGIKLDETYYATIKAKNWFFDWGYKKNITQALSYKKFNEIYGS